jgi:hypothetical protein
MKIFTLFTAFVCAISMNAQLLDPGFEGGAVASGWTQVSTNFVTPLCTVVGCGDCGGGCMPYEGEWFAWFGGAGPSTEELGALTQVIDIPSGTSASLTFWCVVGAPEDSLPEEHVDVHINGEIVWALRADMTNYYTYTQKTIDMTSYLGQSDVTIGLAGYSNEGSSILFDAFNLVVDGQNQVGINDILNREKAINFYPNPANEVYKQ